jgi:thymidylate synthase (FAD)
MDSAMTVATTQQPKPNGDGADVTDLVLRDLQLRREAGTRKYGTPLRTFNGRDALVDAYQESLDLTVYLRQRIGEEEHTLRDKADRMRFDAAREAAGCVPTGRSLLPKEMPPIELTSKITVRMVQSMGGDAMVVAAAKVSTSGEEALKFADPSCADANKGLINYLMAHRHGTPFEHAAMTFFVHAPIFVWREWHRHRIGFSYNEESARYKQLNPVFWVPGCERKIVPAAEHTSARPQFQSGTVQQIDTLRDALAESYRVSYATYAMLLEAGYAKEVARACLPVGIYSSCWVTCNPRSLMAFLSLRTHDPAAKFVSYPQAEIEQAARVAEQILSEGWPLTYAAFVKNGRVGP